MKSKLYTRTGDDGTTSLVGGTRAPKDSLRLEAYGTIDELNSWIGLLAASLYVPLEQQEVLLAAQDRLFDIGAALATEPESKWQPEPITHQPVEDLEKAIDALDAELPPLNKFVLPGGHPDAARANVARTVARRAERRVIAVGRHTKLDPDIVKYINRLSDYLFALARTINHNNGFKEVYWGDARKAKEEAAAQ